MELKEIKEALKNLITPESKPEEVEAITKIAVELDGVQKDFDIVINRLNETNKKYIEAVTNATFKGTTPPQEDNNKKPITLEDSINKVVSERK